MHNIPSFIRSLAAVAAILVIAQSARAVNATWTGLSTANSSWTTTDNWSASPVPATGNIATFNGAGNGRTTVNLSNNPTVLGIVFDTASVASYTIGSTVGNGSFTFNSSGGPNVTINSTVTNDQTINSNLISAGQTNFVNNSTTATLHLAGTLVLQTTVGASRIQIFRGAGNILLSGDVSNGANTNGYVLSVTKQESGTLTLSGNNSYTGATTVSAGTLLINGDQSAATGAVTVAADATLGGTGIIGGATAINATGTLAVGAGGVEGNLRFSDSLALGGGTTFDLAGNSRGVAGGYDAVTLLDSDASLTYSGVLTLNVTSLLSAGTFDLFSFGAGKETGGFSSVLLTGGIYTGFSFAEVTPGIWEAASGDTTFTFTESTGDLVLAVPEPSPVWTLLSAFGFFLLLRRRALPL